MWVWPFCKETLTIYRMQCIELLVLYLVWIRVWFLSIGCNALSCLCYTWFGSEFGFFFFPDNFCCFHSKQNDRGIIGISFTVIFFWFFYFSAMLSLLPIIVFNVKGRIKLKKKLDSPTLKLSGFPLTPFVMLLVFT